VVIAQSQALDPLTRPAPSEESAGAGHPLPQGGEGWSFYIFHAAASVASQVRRESLDSSLRSE
jgi:hypothetical protein